MGACAPARDAVALRGAAALLHVTTLLRGSVTVLCLGACAAPVPVEEPYQRAAGEAFGTTWHVTWRGPAVPEVEAAVVATLARVDERMSSWREDSELSEIRRSDGPVVVSEETAEVVQAALELASATDGAFDPTVEPLMRLWGFRGGRLEHAPDDAAIEAARARVGFHRVEVFRHGGVPLVQGDGTALDLSAIAKGHAVDAIALSLSRLGAADHLVEVGGEVRVAGRGPSGPWRLAVDAPDPTKGPGEEAAATLSLTNISVASSGDYRTVYEVDGQRVAHTMDPRTGRPVVSSVLGTTVVAPDCRAADGWATALMVLPPDVGLHAIEARPDLEAFWVLGTDAGVTVQRSSGLGDWLARD